jgi:hypothetical protein
MILGVNSLQFVNVIGFKLLQTIYVRAAYESVMQCYMHYHYLKAYRFPQHTYLAQFETKLFIDIVVFLYNKYVLRMFKTHFLLKGLVLFV